MRVSFPERGKPWAEISSELDRLASMDVPEERGRLTMYSLKGSPELQKVAEQAWLKFFSRNGLFSLAMPSIMEMEVEVCGMIIDLLGGDDQARAAFTSGGTESIFGALHAIREWARATKSIDGTPKILAPYTAHAAFSKGCHYFGMELSRIPCGPDWRADLGAIEGAIDERTVAIVGSAPQWPHGRYDDIAGLAALARDRELWMHTDACFGGLLAPFVRDLGYPIPDFDLSVPGVCSISADLHKYGYAAKPASVVAFCSQEHYDFMPHWVEDWPSGLYPTSTLLGSRPGGAIAAAWAVMKHLGRSGYCALAKQTMDTKERLLRGIASIEYLTPWDNELSILVVEGEGVDITGVSAAMDAKGWFMMGTEEPPLLHMTLDPVDEDWTDLYLADLSDAVQEARSGSLKGGNLRYV